MKDWGVEKVTGTVGARITQACSLLSRGDWRTKGLSERAEDLERFLWYGEMRWSGKKGMTQKTVHHKRNRDVHVREAWTKRSNREKKREQCDLLTYYESTWEQKEQRWLLSEFLLLFVAINRSLDLAKKGEFSIELTIPWISSGLLLMKMLEHK